MFSVSLSFSYLELQSPIISAHFTNFLDIISKQPTSWQSTVALVASAHAVTTIALFIYVLLTPWIKGVEPNYRDWRKSGLLSSVIPILSYSIVVGWLLSVFALGNWSSFGYVKGSIGVSAFYALIFGLMGLIPAPKVNRK